MHILLVLYLENNSKYIAQIRLSELTWLVAHVSDIVYTYTLIYAFNYLSSLAYIHAPEVTWFYARLDKLTKRHKHIPK